MTTTNLPRVEMIIPQELAQAIADEGRRILDLDLLGGWDVNKISDMVELADGWAKYPHGVRVWADRFTQDQGGLMSLAERITGIRIQF